MEFPLLNATWFGNCFPVGGGFPSGGGPIIDPRYLMFVTGWAMDTSVAQERGGVAHVVLEMDGVTIKDSRVDCHREFLLANALVDCYGYYRPDIEVLYPGFQQAPNVGFQFFVDVGYLITQRKFKEGAHMLQIKAIDKEDSGVPPEGNADRHGVRHRQPRPAADRLDRRPDELQVHRGRVPGRRLGAGPRLRREGAHPDRRHRADRRRARRGLRRLRLREPGHRDSSTRATRRRTTARFRFYLDTTQISNSEHDLLIEVTDTRGNVRSAGTRRFIVDNNTLVR